MIKSMTGFGRGQFLSEAHDITVEIRSVNHRYFEFSSRMPRFLAFAEEKMKSFIQASVVRGKVEVSVSMQTIDGSDVEVLVNRPILECYVTALRQAAEDLGLPDTLSSESLLRMNEAFTLRKKNVDEEVVLEEVMEAAKIALERFVAMREQEGAHLKEDILSRLQTIETAVSQVEVQNVETVRKYREKLYNKLQELLQERQIDDQRVLTEAAIFAERIAVDEETVRLKSHIQQMRAILEEEGSIGRKLDFLVQEFNREANTIGSKAQDVAVAQIVVNIKSEIEKIREQIQNIE